MVSKGLKMRNLVDMMDSPVSPSLTLKNKNMKIEKIDDNVNSSGNDIVDIRFWLGSFRVKINQLVNAVNTITESQIYTLIEAPKQPQEESKDEDEVDWEKAKRQQVIIEHMESQIRADERLKILTAIKIKTGILRDASVYDRDFLINLLK